jgi:hypothetical protein
MRPRCRATSGGATIAAMVNQAAPGGVVFCFALCARRIEGT